MTERQRFRTFRRGGWSMRILVVSLIVGYSVYAVVSQLNETQSSTGTVSPPLLVADIYHSAIVAAAAELADQYHYRNRPLNNEFSEEILAEFLNALDPRKMYFLASDIRNFESNRYYYDNFLKKGKLDEVFAIYRTYRQRVQERTDYAISMLDFPFDFELNDTLQSDRSEAPWPSSQGDRDALWKHLIKNDILSLKLNGEEEKQIRETLASRYERINNSVAMSNAFDVIEVFLNAYLKELDPHSEFFSPHSSSNLRISISQQIQGIGAMLRTENEYVVVQGIIRGGPADLSKNLHAGDRIIAVAGDDDRYFQDIVGWRIEDVVDLIRGPKETTVHLKVLRKDATPGTPAETIELVRQTVRLEEQMAKKSTIEIDSDGKILQLGVIQLPAFYSNVMDMDDSDESPSSSADDIKEFLIEFQEQLVDGLVMDLRGNGGGALHEAVELTSMFIPSGPVVQVENGEKELDIHADKDEQVVYDGPLVVLVDRGSASASEIFTGAMQDYGRGIVVGETTFGKGTLQNIWPLNQLAKTDKIDLGALKLSTAQFFRVNGVSTQHLGIIPDVLFPTNEFISKSGERALENALPESAIEPPLRIRHWHRKFKINNRISEIRQLNRARMELNPLVDILVERERLSFNRVAPSTISLNESKRKQSLDSDLEEQLDYINQVRSIFALEPVDAVSNDAFPSEQFGDVFLDEAINILADLVTLERVEFGS